MQYKVVSQLSNEPSSNSNNTYNVELFTGTFTNASLVDGVLIIEHNKGSLDTIVKIKNPSGYNEFVKDKPTEGNEVNSITVDFGGPGSTIEAGTWTYSVTIYVSVGSISSYSGVTLQNLKTFLRIDEANDADDSLLISMRDAAIELIEKKCCFKLSETTIDMFFEDYDIDESECLLTVYPFSEVVKAEIIDNTGTKTETTFTVLGLNEAVVKLDNYYEGNKAVIRYKCGYGITDKTESAPLAAREAIINQVADWYENRTDWTPVLSTKIKRMLKDITFASWI